MTKTDIKNTGYDREMLSAFRLADLGGFFKDALRVVVRNKTGEAVEELAYEECGSNRSEYIEFAQKLHEEAELFRDMLHRLHRRRRMSLDFDEAMEWFANVSAKYVLDDLRETNAYPRQKGSHELLLSQRVQWLVDHDMDPHDASYEDEFKLSEYDCLDDVIRDILKEDDNDE